MARFSIDYKSEYELKTFNDVKNTYDFIIKAIEKLELKHLKYSCSFVFYSGKISCSCDSIDEFTQHAYGVSEFKINNFNIHIYDGNIPICFFNYSLSTLSITSSSKIWLEKIVKFLDETNIDNEMPINNIIVNQYNQSGTIIQNGDGNKVEDCILNVNSHDVNISKNASQQNGVIDFFKGVWQGICANWIWWILGILGVSFISYIAGKK